MLKRIAIKPRFKQHIWQTLFSIKIFIAFWVYFNQEWRKVHLWFEPLHKQTFTISSDIKFALKRKIVDLTKLFFFVQCLDYNHVRQNQENVKACILRRVQFMMNAKGGKTPSSSSQPFWSHFSNSLHLIL